MNAKTLKETEVALKKAGYNQVHAAAELGVSRGCMTSRVSALRAAGRKVPTFKRAAASARPAAKAPPELAAELKAERAKVAMLEEDLRRARAVAPTQPVRPKKRLREKEDRVVVVFPDVHGSSADALAVSAFLGDVKALDPDMVIGLGDLIDCGGFLAQHHVMGFVAETEYSYEDDLQAAGRFLDAVQAAAPRAEFRLIEGNHDARTERWAVTQSLRKTRDAEFLRRLVSPQEVLGFSKRGIAYYRRTAIYDDLPVQGATKVGKLIFAHGLLNGNSDPNSILNRFATNVVYGHTHQMASKVRRTADGPIGAWNLGTLAKLQPLYAHSSPTLWTHGYGVFVFARSGRFQPIPVTILNGESLLPGLVFKP